MFAPFCNKFGELNSIIALQHPPNAKTDAFGCETARFAKEKRVVEPVVLAVARRFEFWRTAEVEARLSVGVFARYNQTAVANQQQIIAGISSGVQAANAEQNALLRRQNEILLGILEKETTVRLGASSAFGRITQQSLDMYRTATGVNA